MISSRAMNTILPNLSLIYFFWIMNQVQILFRFKDKENLPANKETVRAMHKDIQTVRLPRQAQKRVLFAFAEFGTEEKCEEAKVRVIIHIVIFKCSR